MNPLLTYLPMDRRLALAQGVPLPARASGAALFADLAGFTALTEALARVYGPQRGAEEITIVLNRVYEALSAHVDRYGGSIITLAGDALIAWFDGDTGQRACAAGLAMLHTMQAQPAVVVDGQGFALQLKATVATGPIRRLLVGDPAVQQLEILAGSTMRQLAAAADVTQPGELVVAAETLPGLIDHVELAPVGEDGSSRPPHATVRALTTAIPEQPTPASVSAIDSEQARSWLLPPVYQRLQAGQGEFLAELRYTVSLFLHFAEQDYDGDEAAGPRLDHFIRHVQGALARRHGFLLHVLLGDKGSTLFAAFGAPVAFGDEPTQAARAALELLDLPPDLTMLGPVRIGLSDGRAWAGSYGGSTRTYSLLGDTTNIAARLMQAAQPGQVLLTASLAARLGGRFDLSVLPSLRVKGKARPVEVQALLRVAEAGQAKLHEPQYTLPLVGRAAEVARFEPILAQGQAGQGQIVALAAEAGMGKSRLLAELVRRATEVGFAVYIGEGQATGTRTPYLAWQSIWRGLFGVSISDLPAAQAARLEAALREINLGLLPRLPLLGVALDLPLPDNPTTAGMDTRLRKEALEALLLDVLRARAQRGPLLLALDDSHWLDPLSLDLLHVVGRAVTGLPVVVVVAARPMDTEPTTTAPLARLPGYTELRLDALEPIDAMELARRKTVSRYGADVAPTPAFIEAITQRAEGNPFYIEELINYLHDQDVRPDDATTAELLDLPGSLASLILSRIDRLTVEQQTTLKVASIVGRVFKLRWLWGVYPELGPAERVRGSLDELERLDLTPLDTPEPDLSYLFKHALTQEVAYASLPFTQRAQLHEQLARWLEGATDASPSVDLLAYHYGHSRNTAKQREYYQKAGDAATARYANASAIQYYERLLEVLAPDEQGPTLIALGQVLRLIGAWDKAERRFQTALVLADETGNRLLRARAQVGVGAILLNRSNAVEAAPRMQQAQADFIQLGATGEAVQAAIALATLYWYHNKADEAEALLAQSLDLEGEDGDKGRLAAIFHLLAMVALTRPDYGAVKTWSERSLALKRKRGDGLGAARSLVNLALAAYAEGRYSEAHTLIGESFALAQEAGAIREQGMAREIMAMIFTALGRPAAAWPLHAENLVLFRDMRVWWEVAASLIGIAEATLALDATPEAHRTPVRLASASDKLLAAIGGVLPPVHQTRAARLVTAARQRLTPDEMERAWDEGRLLTAEEVVACALSGEADTPVGRHPDME